MHELHQRASDALAALETLAKVLSRIKEQNQAFHAATVQDAAPKRVQAIRRPSSMRDLIDTPPSATPLLSSRMRRVASRATSLSTPGLAGTNLTPALPRLLRDYFSGENAVSLILSTTQNVMTAAAMR